MATPLVISHTANVSSNTKSGNHTAQVTGDDQFLGPPKNPAISRAFLSVIVYSDRSACSTSTRAARAAGISDAMIAAVMSKAVAPTTGIAPGSCTVVKNLAARRASR